ncbi:hypothetical protein SAMN06265368_3745 [Cohaesibacter gelatinilyticus]|uniref:Uncharacterized protein n=1 Tax=Cohaesibacter gelatinilyticus TaxID=372072 RepID=A0A285PKL6_9HYPH|nr:hypothetical protein SAMN06265368_3745 [Cohaesibacter gelatinilyticus]
MLPSLIDCLDRQADATDSKQTGYSSAKLTYSGWIHAF